MSNSEKILKAISNLIETGVLTSKDIRKEISTDLKFKKDKIIKTNIPNSKKINIDNFSIKKEGFIPLC